jgi:hypothetical protein
MIFQSSMDLGKSKCDVPSGTTQGWDCPIVDLSINLLVYILDTFESIYNYFERKHIHLNMHLNNHNLN